MSQLGDLGRRKLGFPSSELSKRRNCKHPRALNGPASAHQVKDEDHDRYNQQQVDEASTHMKTETQQPQNSQNNDDRPKHLSSPMLMAALIPVDGRLCHDAAVNDAAVNNVAVNNVALYLLWNTVRNCSWTM